MNTVKIGVLGETIIGTYLERKGHIILAKNFRTSNGEIDIVTRFGKDIHFVEVKLRKNREYGNASQAVNYKKKKRIRKVAGEFLQEEKFFYRELFFDVAEVYTDEKLINYIENAF